MIITFKEIIKLIFPPKCTFCRSILPIQSDIEICDACFPLIPFFNDDIIKFGKKHDDNFYDDVICLCEYTGIMKQAIKKYKFFDKPQYYRTFGRLLSEKMKKVTNYQNFDIIISIPLHKRKEALRGYNQSYLITKVLSRELGVPEKSYLLVRVRNTSTQSLLAKAARRSNVKDAFRVKNSSSIMGKTVLLVDDVFTTGNTLNECSRILKQAGAKEVVAAVIATGRKY